MTDDEKALKWLDEVIGHPVDFNGERMHARRIREMLKRSIVLAPPGPRGCPSCGAADWKPMSYSCGRSDCPTRGMA